MGSQSSVRRWDPTYRRVLARGQSILICSPAKFGPNFSCVKIQPKKSQPKKNLDRISTKKSTGRYSFTVGYVEIVL
jgi:hypothetical protein